MGLFKSKEQVKENLIKEAEALLIEGEMIENIYSLVIDFVAITNKRILYVDNKVVSSKKYIVSLPFSKITAVMVEKGGPLVVSSEIAIYTGHFKTDMKFYNNEDAALFYKQLLSKIL